MAARLRLPSWSSSGSRARVDNQLQVVTATRPAQPFLPWQLPEPGGPTVLSDDLPVLGNLACCTLFLFLPINPSPDLKVHFLVRSQTSPAWNSHPTQRPHTPKNRRQRKGLECQNSCYEGWALSLQGRHQGLCSVLDLVCLFVLHL